MWFFLFPYPSYVVVSFYSTLHVGTAIGEQEHPPFPDKFKVLLFCPSCWHSNWRAETSHFPGQVQGAAQVQGPPESGFLSVSLTFNKYLSVVDRYLPFDHHTPIHGTVLDDTALGMSMHGPGRSEELSVFIYTTNP